MSIGRSATVVVHHAPIAIEIEIHGAISLFINFWVVLTYIHLHIIENCMYILVK